MHGIGIVWSGSHRLARVGNGAPSMGEVWNFFIITTN